MYTNVRDVVAAYLESLKGRASYRTQCTTAKQWLLTLTTTPTRREILARHQAKGHGPFMPGACQANTELALLRAAWRWGIYHEVWDGDDPTVGIKKWKTRKRKRIAKFHEIKLLLDYFAKADAPIEIRDRAIYGLMLLTGCRPGEARTVRMQSITPYGTMACWNKGLTKNGEEYEVPIPAQVLPWLAAWKASRPTDRPSPYLFPGLKFEEPMTMDAVVRRWHELRLIIGLKGLWNYDIRRTLTCYMSNELKVDSRVIDAILGHENPTALGHYLHVSFDAMTDPMQRYADWLCSLQAHDRLPS